MNDKQQQVKDMVADGFARLLTQLQQGKSEPFVRYLDFAARFHRYSAHNAMLIFLQRPDAIRVAGYQKWQELKRQVRRGEKGIAIFAPLAYKVADAEDQNGDAAIVRLRGFRVVYVFDVAQTDGAALPEFWIAQPDDAEAVYQHVKQAVEVGGITVEETDLPGGVQGESRGGRITLQRNRDSRSRAMTLVHEWAHEILHRTLPVDELRRMPIQQRECQAEAVAFIVSRYLGFDNPFSSDYLLSYGNTPEELTANLGAIQKAAGHIIGQLEACHDSGTATLTAWREAA